ncbi:MAG: FtsX-like permease family protein [Verrucomicrobiota bacterium]
MLALDRKLVRDFRQMKGQAAAIAAVVACGVALFIMSLATLVSMQESQRAYYERYRFAEIFVSLKRAPRLLEDRLASIPGVSRVQTRIVRPVNLNVVGMSEPATGRIISIPEFDDPKLNALHLRSGRYVEPWRENEVLVGEAFAEAHGLEPGDTVRAVLNGRLETLEVVGIALSPEYIAQIPPGSFLPDDRRYGIFWMGERAMEAAFDMESAFNNATMRLTRSASVDRVIEQVDSLLKPYGGLGAYDRDDNVSHRFISDEISQLKTMGLFVPAIFLGVAAFLLNVVLRRLLSLQRDQIAALKAFGYTDAQIGWHYMKLVLMIVVFGFVVGVVMGIFLGKSVTGMYAAFYRFPVFEFHLDPPIIVASFAITSGAAFVGVYGAVRSAVTLPPAEAMRPPSPPVYSPTVIERLGIERLFSQQFRMILRELERRWAKSLLSAFGISLALSILIVGNFGNDAIDYLMHLQFFVSDRSDMQIVFREVTSGPAIHEVAQLPGVTYAEPFRSVPARLRAGHRMRQVGVLGLQPKPELFRPIDADEQVVAIPKEGLLLSEKLAEILAVRAGDPIKLEVLEGERPVLEVFVAGTVNDFSGLSVYVDRLWLSKVMGEGEAISGAFLSVDEQSTEALYERLKHTPAVAGSTIKVAALQSFLETFAENILRMRAFNIFFACVIAFGVVYNNARIALSERSRELATLRVIGFTRREITGILIGELSIITALAIPLGLGLGHFFCYLLSFQMDTEMYRIPFVLHSSTYATAVVVVVIAAIISSFVVRKRLRSLDLIAVLKTRE